MSYSTYKQGLVPAQHNNQIKKDKPLRGLPIITGVLCFDASAFERKLAVVWIY